MIVRQNLLPGNRLLCRKDAAHNPNDAIAIGIGEALKSKWPWGLFKNAD